MERKKRQENKINRQINIGMVGDKRAHHITPGRVYRKTPQVFLDAQMEFEAQPEFEPPKELKIGSRGVSTALAPGAQPGATPPKKAGPPAGQAQQSWALKNRILDLEKQLSRAQAQVSRREEEGMRLAELNLATSVESREVIFFFFFFVCNLVYFTTFISFDWRPNNF
jgi:hypothetical protein